KWGPLALRDAALMYYPLSAVFGYVFYQPKLLQKSTTCFWSGLMIGIFALSNFKILYSYEYFLFMGVIIAYLLIRAYPEKNIRWFLLSLLVLAIPYGRILQSSRTMFIGIILSSIFALTGLLLISSIRLKDKTL